MATEEEKESTDVISSRHSFKSSSSSELGKKLIIDRHDFDCPLCFELLYEPITIECGHTFCRYCLHQTFELKQNCPICRQHSIIDPVQCPLNVLISKILEKYNNYNYSKRATELLKLKNTRRDRHPIFVSRIPEFPHCKISLHIYEAKYRVMVNRICNKDSKFIISYMQYPSQTPHLIATLAKIINCTSLADGRSIIEVLGIKRVKLSNIKLESNSFGLLSAEIEDYNDIILTTSTNNDNNNNNNQSTPLLNDKKKSINMKITNQSIKKYYQLFKNNNNNKKIPENESSSSTSSTSRPTSAINSNIALAESELMHNLLSSVEKFISQEEGQNNKNIFYQRVGEPPRDSSSFSLWIGGSLPRTIISTGFNHEIASLQINILKSQNVSERLKLAQNLATICIKHQQKRGQTQFWIIVCIISLAVLYELFNINGY